MPPVSYAILVKVYTKFSEENVKICTEIFKMNEYNILLDKICEFKNTLRITTHFVRFLVCFLFFALRTRNKKKIATLRKIQFYWVQSNDRYLI